MAKSGIKSGLRSARKQHIINNNNNESRVASTTIQAEAAVKEEPVNEEFKEFAETAMNELLGWYGYGSSVARDSGGAEKARPGSYKSNSNSNSSSPVSPLHANGCGWCGKSVDENNGLLSGQSSFCSELCFSQSRRANFKKNKTCDWCRHVRHTVSYVDFQEGSAQLQFCSDKCLNQYKMHIFCRETRAHLEFHPHLVSSSGGDSAAGSSGNIGLITPDLWLKDCKTPPEEDALMEDDGVREVRDQSPNLRKGSAGIKMDKVEGPRRGCSIDKVPKLIPIITLAPTSSLLASPSGSLKRSPLIKKTRNKRKRFSSATITSQSTPNTSTSSINSLHLDEEVAQDLRVRHNITPPPRTIPNLPEKQSNLIETNVNKSPPIVLTNLISSTADVSTVPVQSTRTTASPVDVRLPNISSNHDSNQQESNRPSPNISMMPPVTVLVPYPIMVPIPLPIPIPLPVSSFLRAYFGAKAGDVKDQQANNARIEREMSEYYDRADKVEGRECGGAAAEVEGATSSSGVVAADEEIVVDVVGDVPKSPRMLRRRRRKMLVAGGGGGEVKGGSSKVIRKKI